MIEDRDPARRRQRAPEAVKYSTERQQTLAYRERIGALQSRVAFAVAMADSALSANRDAIAAEFRTIQSGAEDILADLTQHHPESVGPADDCQRALKAAA